MKLLFSAIFILSCIVNVLHAQAINTDSSGIESFENCASLVAYRDNQLYVDYSKTFTKHLNYENHINLINAVKAQLVEENNYALSSVAAMAVVVEVLCNSIDGIISIISPNAKVVVLAKKNTWNFFT